MASKLQELLPTPAQEALARQTAKLERDWEGVQGAFLSETDADAEAATALHTRYTNAWLLVNSRTFYYTTARSATVHPQHDDHMAMQPVADLFNHAADGGCRVTYGPEGFCFVADRLYAAGDEVPISYGAHADDMLLVEYGFVLAAPGIHNRWDEVCLDAAILPRMAAFLRADLEEAGFLGRYMIDADTPGGCYRTQVASAADPVWADAAGSLAAVCRRRRRGRRGRQEQYHIAGACRCSAGRVPGRHGRASTGGSGPDREAGQGRHWVGEPAGAADAAVAAD